MVEPVTFWSTRPSGGIGWTSIGGTIAFCRFGQVIEHSPTFSNVVFDCHDLDLVSAFWQAALRWPEREVRDRDALVAPPGWGFPRLAFRQVEGAKQVMNRVHLDLTADDMTAEVRRLERLGAKRGLVLTEGLLLTAMRDPRRATSSAWPNARTPATEGATRSGGGDGPPRR
jgi:hypothetical protein